MWLQRWFPSITSIGVILLVSLLRDRSRALAAVIAVMPINIPLALWVVSAATGQDPTKLAAFTRTLFLGLLPGLLWLGLAYAGFRAGWPLWKAVGLAYLVWGALIGLGFAAGWLAP